MSNSNFPEKSNPSGDLSPINAAAKVFDARNQVFRPIIENRITRNNPCAIVLLLDQSASMNKKYLAASNENKIMAEEVAEAINQFFDYLIFRSTSGTDIREYFTFLVIGYGSRDGANVASLAWEGKLIGKDWVNVKELAANILSSASKVEKKIHHWGEEYEEKTTSKIWIKPKADGRNTPMLAALKLCKAKLEDFIETRSDNLPPVVFNLTDGRPTDVTDLAELTSICDDIKSINTSFGKTMLFNCLLSDFNQNRSFFPRITEKDKIGIDRYHAALFDASSILPDFILEEAYKMFKDEKYKGVEEIKGLLLNVEPAKLLSIFTFVKCVT